MDGKNEEFWRKIPEEAEIGTDGQYLDFQLQGQASQLAVQAIRDLYRIDEDDRRSVQQAWVQLTQRAGEIADEQDVSTRLESPEPGMFFKHPGRIRKTPQQRRWNLLAACLTAFLLLGGILSLLVVLPGRGGQQGAPRNGTTPTQQGRQVTMRLGTRLGNITLGEPIANVIAFFQPTMPEKDVLYDSKLAYLKYEKFGIEIGYSSDQRVAQIVVWPRFAGTTVEHFAPGMSFDQFVHIYPQFTLMKMQDLARYEKALLLLDKGVLSGVSVSDGYGTVLLVFFDAKQVAIRLILESRV